jgi:membrane protease YdiL (CAAX protease family)
LIYFYGLVNGLLFDGISKISIVAFWIQDFTYFVLIPLAYLTYAYRKYQFKPADYGLIKGSPTYPTTELIGASIFVGIFLGVLVIPLDYLSYYMFYSADSLASKFSYKDVVPSGALKFPIIFYLAITAGLMEEIIYRGIPRRLIFEQQSLRYKKTLFIIGTSIAFSTIHWTSGMYNLAPTFIYGVLAAMLYLKLKNLWPLVGAHFLYDFYIFW